MGELTQRLLKLLCLPQSQLSESLGVPYDTVRGWSSGRADPTRANRTSLAAFMREHAKRLLGAAAELGGERGNMDFRYATEKLGAAVRILMLPNRDDEAASIAGAWHEIQLALKAGEDLGQHDANRSRDRIFDFMGTAEGSQERARQLSHDEKGEFCHCVWELEAYCRGEFWGYGS